MNKASLPKQVYSSTVRLFCRDEVLSIFYTQSENTQATYPTVLETVPCPHSIFFHFHPKIK
jgi:hypothetical protein